MDTITEIKKELYRVKPTAKLIHVKKGHLTYKAVWGGGEVNPPTPLFQAIFMVPFDDIGDAEFLPEMPAQSLIRYLI